MTDYTLIRSSRKTTAIYVRNGGVEVRAPLKKSKDEIDRFVASKEKWITGNLAKSREQARMREAFSLNYGATVRYRGREYPIAARSGNRTGFDDTEFYMPPGLTSEQIQAACIRIYLMLARRDLTAKTLDFAGRMGIKPSAVKINGAKTRWGSCSAKKSVNFSWRLVVADDALIDYVIVHELAHLSEMNHSARFWAVVEGVLPDFRERRAQLRELHKRLATEDW